MNSNLLNYISHFKSCGYLIGGYIVGYYIGMLVIKDNPFFLLVALSVPLCLILFTNPNISLYLIIFSVFFADWSVYLGLIPPQLTLLPEAALFFLTIRILILKHSERKFIKNPINIPILLFILLGLISTFINSQSIGTAIVGFRFDLKYVLMFFLVVNLNPDEQFFKRMIRILIILLLIQVPVSLVKLKIYGQGESAIGTYAGYGGVPSTMLPLIAISIFLGFFLFEKPRLQYIFASLSFVLFSIIGGKRAFAFFLFLLLLFLLWQSGKKNLIKLSFVAPFFIVGVLACVYFIPTLNPAFKNPHYLLDYIISYETSRTETGKAGGRTAAIITAYNVAKENPSHFLLGYGPGCLAQSYFISFESSLVFPFAYGQSQWVTMSLEYGWVGTLLFLWLFIPLFKVNHRFFQVMNDKYWKAISFGFKGILFTYLMGFFYAVVFRDDMLAFIFWFFAATIYCMGEQKIVR